jgi:hypothetical protein
MGRGRQRSEETTIPYYQLRQTVERGYGRHNMVHKNIWHGAGIGLVAAFIYVVMAGVPNSGITPIQIWGAPWTTTAIIGAFFGLAAWLILVVTGLLMEQTDYSSKEAALVEACIAEIKKRGFHSPPTIKALRASASGAAEAVQIRTPLPLAIVAAMFAVFSSDAPALVKGVIGEIGLTMLLYMVLVSGQGNADLIIRNALTELERRQEEEALIAEAEPPASLAPASLPAPSPADVTPAHTNGAADHAARR